MPRPCSAAPSSWWGWCSIAARSRAARFTGSSSAWSCWPAPASSTGGSCASSAESVIEERHGFCRGAPNVGGCGGHIGAPHVLEHAVAAGAGGEASGALAALTGVDRRLAQLELAAQRGVQGSTLALVGRAAVAQDAVRRERGDLRRQRLRRRARLAPGHHAIRQTDPLGFARIYGTSG